VTQHIPFRSLVRYIACTRSRSSLYQSVYTKFGVPNFTIYKDMIEAKL